MMKTFALLSICLIGCVSAGHSAHGEQILRDPTTSWYATDILEDASLDVFSLIRKYGFPAEIHRVITSDGYILEMHRIPHGRNQNNDPSVDRPVAFIMHGLLSSSADWVNMGPNRGLAYILAEEGYDVWMGNNRGNFYSRRHISLNPDNLFNRMFWDFSWHEIGSIDLPAMIDYILAQTRKDSLHYIGHSQGTTAFFVMAASLPEYNAKITTMQAFAPVAYMDNVPNLLMRAIAPFATPLQWATSMMGLNEFFPNTQIMSWAGIALCYQSNPINNQLCQNVLFVMGGMNPAQVNTTMVPVKMGHTPAGAANKQFSHYGQLINSGGFHQWDHGPMINLMLYGQLTPPTYPLERITAPVALHYALVDSLADVRDVHRVFREISNPIGLFLVPDNDFTHLDFMWAIDARSLLYDRVIDIMRQYD